MTKAELIDRIAGNVEGVTKAQVLAVYDQAFDGIVEALKSDAKHKFTVQGFGTFDVRTRDARKGRNPATGESIDIAASTSVGFKASEALKAKFE